MKDKIILLGVHGRPSIQGVYSLMTTPDVDLVVKRVPMKGKPYYRLYTNNNSDSYDKLPLGQDFSNKIVIRWGTREEVDPKLAYNNVKALAKATDKRQSRIIFQGSEVRVPEVKSPSNYQIGDVVIGRPINHSKGKNFVVFRDYGSFEYHFNRNNSGWYYSAFVDKTEEFRVHVAHGKILTVMKKPAPDNPSEIRWNRSINNEQFDAVRWSEANIDVCKQAIKAVKSLGLDFGAADVIVKDGQAYVLEVNTAPTLNSSELNTKKYAQYFDFLFAATEKEKHFDVMEKKKVESLFWKPFNFERREPNTKDE